jgi:hypothetical protein
VSGDVRGLFAQLGVDLAQRASGNVSVRCFAAESSHRRSDRRASCSVSLDSGAWKCHGCGAAGGAYDAALTLGRTPAEAMALLERFGLVDGSRGSAGDRSAQAVSASEPRPEPELRVIDAEVTVFGTAGLE